MLFGIDLAERWKQWTALLAIVAVLVAGGIRFTRAEDKIVEHGGQLSEHEQEIAVQKELVIELVNARVSEKAASDAAKAARNKICRELREARKIAKGECPPLED